MGSKGDVKEFFGMRLAWRVLASCGCSGVSEPDLLVFGCFGTVPKHCFLLFFMGSKGDAKEFFGMRFAWRVLLVLGCFGTGPIRVFRNRTKALFFIVFYGFQR